MANFSFLLSRDTCGEALIIFKKSHFLGVLMQGSDPEHGAFAA
jgi:hypothetical protein